MSAAMDSLHRLTFRDAFRAGEAMADAFRRDPLWHKLFEGETDLERRYQACFEVPVRHCLKYGAVYATSEDLEGAAAFVPGRFADMSFWRMLRSGAMGCGLRMGSTAARRMSDLRVLSVDRKTITAETPHIYLLVLGVRTAHQGKGHGGALLRALIDDCDRQDLAIYLETETEENVRLYEHFGFRMIKQIRLEHLGVPMWEMMREASSARPRREEA